MAVTDVGGIPVVQTGGYNDGFGGGMGIWAFMIFAIIFGRGGWGGFGGGCAEGAGVANVDNTIWQSQNFQRLENGHNAIQSQLSGIGQGICSATFDLNNSIKDGFYANAMAAQEAKFQLGNGLCSTTFELSRAISDCCCTTNRNIDSVNFNMERNTTALIQAGNANTQRVLDFLICDKLEDKNAKIAEQAQLLSEQRIIAAMKPRAPEPAYIVESPYAFRQHNGCFSC